MVAFNPQAAAAGGQAARSLLTSPYVTPMAQAQLAQLQAQAALSQAKAQDPLLGQGGGLTGGPALALGRARVRSLMTGQPLQVTKEDWNAGESYRKAQTQSLQQRGIWAYMPSSSKLQMLKVAQEKAAAGDRSLLDSILPQMTPQEQQQLNVTTDTGQQLVPGQSPETGVQTPKTVQHPLVAAMTGTPAVQAHVPTEDQQQFGEMAAQTGSELEKETSDETARNRASTSASILSEIKGVNISPMMSYSGPGGAAAYRTDQLSNATGTLTGDRKQRFNDYQTFRKETHKFITDTLRQAMATSVREGYVEKYIADAVANLSQGVDNVLDNNPELALQRWNKLIEYLDHYHNSNLTRVKGGIAGQEQFETGYQKGTALLIPNIPNSTQENIDHTAKQLGISTDEVIQRLRQKHGAA
jgi:hypothetical protein